MQKDEFLSQLDEIVQDGVFIGKTTDDLNDEIANNTWSISMSQNLVSEFTIEELKSFFEKVLKNRKEQIASSGYTHGMIFYAWFEWQSARLRFNLISDFHANLPFSSKYNLIRNLDPIIHEFINFPHHDGFPIIEAENDAEYIDEETEVMPFNVYALKLMK